MRGDETIAGVVRGLGESGELILETSDGELESFHGGEVSLRGR